MAVFDMSICERIFLQVASSSAVGRGVVAVCDRASSMSAKYLTKVAKQMELNTMKACSRETDPVDTMPMSLTIQPFLRLRACAISSVSRDRTTGTSWMNVRLSESVGQMTSPPSRSSSEMMVHRTGSGFAIMRLLMLRASKRARASAGTVSPLEVISSSSP